MKTLTVLLVFSCAALAGVPRIIYTRSFPGSSPEYLRIELDNTGNLAYSESPKDDQPLRAHMAESETAPLFDMAGKLDYFRTPLESGLKVANTGKKVFRYEDGNGASSETAFNYSANETAQKLLDKLEQISASERAYLDLDRTIHFDKLGVNDALAEIEELWVRKQLAAPEQFVPLLTRVASHESFMHLVRERAARLKDEFEKPGPANVAASDPKQK